MNGKTYLVLSTSSYGYQLYDKENRTSQFHEHRRRISYQEKKIIIGDYVTLDSQGFIDGIEERKNLLSRPRLSNCDRVYVLAALTEPEFSSYLLDKFLSLINFSSIPVSIVLTKVDLLSAKKRKELEARMDWYRKLSIPVYFVNTHDDNAYDFPKLREDVEGKTIAFVGQTGVGKSSLLNALDEGFSRKVDALYVNSGRGRHTTKEVVLLPYHDGFLFDTPGFSSLDLVEVKSKDLAYCFPGYQEYFGKCYFTDCLHQEGNKGCKVIDALGKDLSLDSYRNYLKILEEVKENDKWKKKL